MIKRTTCYLILVGLALLTLAGCKDEKKIQAEQQSLVKEALAEMVPVAGGSFMMGDFGPRVAEHLPYSFDLDNKPEHKVTLDSFSISKYRVTWAQFNRYRAMLGLPENDFYQHFKKVGKEYESYQALLGEKYPASVYWQEAKDFCQWLGKVSGEKVDLPTEAQWEYAARSRGQLFIFANNNNVYEPNKNFTGDIRPVGSYPPNPLGLYDMMGNGQDWVNDWYAADYYQHSSEHNPRGPEKGKEKVLRGSVGQIDQKNLVINRYKIALDYFEKPKSNPPGYGFRCVINPPEVKNLTLDLKTIRDSKEARVELIEKINTSQGDVLKSVSLETKGEVIAVLIDTNLWDGVANPVKHDAQKCGKGTILDARKRAVLATLKWVQSKRDYEDVMQHMEIVPTIDRQVSWQTNEAKVIAFLSEGEAPKNYGRSDNFIPLAAKVTIQTSHYAENLREIYRSLPAVQANINEPLKPVNVALLSSCTQVTVEQHGWQKVNVVAH
ncbi:formylglycine-generating enzyme family protein [Photorhabdus sp. CRCIA-P01]|uniref:formylglycine-generating enzyme family protein n=1 Tax=Photorhabdus sp. CRCIA-P01 TaxID=2019570 RepID=UPI000E59C1A2|nr:SUMF1/EgtB/PvdO family nonheme iron enzyme [Photorhabdus sp. CRCIA-P01]